MTPSPPPPAQAPLLSALDAWCMQPGRRGIALRHPRPSCAYLSLAVRCDDRSAANDAASRLAEVLRVVELLSRPGIDPLALHRLTNGSATGCNMGQQWCSYCDGVDRRVVVRLSPTRPLWGRPIHHEFLAVLRAALFDWDDSTACPEYHELRSLVLAKARGAQRSQPVRLEINVVAVDTDAIFQDLESLLPLLKQAKLFEFVLRHMSSLNRRAMASIAASRLPVHVTDLKGWLVCSDDSEDGDNRETIARSVELDEEEDEFRALSRANVIAMKATASWEEPQLDRQMEALRTWSPELKVLHLDITLPDYDVRPAWDERRIDVLQKTGRALFDIDSTLRLDKLIVIAPICQRDVERLVASEASIAAPVERDDVKHRSIDFQRFDLSTLQGVTLGRLLSSSGGVQSLRLLSSVTALSIAEIPALLRSCPTLRELWVIVSCNGWESIANTQETLYIETLVLCISDRDSSLIANGIETLLRVVGHSLVSLSVRPQHRTTALSATLGAVIAQRCPQLQQLTARNPQRGFVSNLLNVYATQPCRLRGLSIVSGGADERYDELVAALSTTTTHPLARVLRSLYVDVCGWETDAEKTLETQLQHMLKVNKQLHDVTFAAFYSGADLLGGEQESEKTCEWWSTVAPLRHRLATLSALRRRGLPEGVLSRILTMAGRPTIRYRREDKFSDFDDSETYDDHDM